MTDKTLQFLTVRVQQALTRERMEHAARQLTISTHSDYLSDLIALNVRTEIAVEHLPPTRLPFTVTGVQQYPVWATWWDHLKHTYQLRWWARWWVSRHPARHRWTEVRVSQMITVPVRAAWKYPHVPHVPSTLGRTYLHTWVDPTSVDQSDAYDWPQP